MRRSLYFATLLCLAATSAATAQLPSGTLRDTAFHDGDSEEARKAYEFRKLRVSGMKLNRLVRKVRKLKWHSSLSNAKKQAKREGKPILWIQALGNLNSIT
ncbi:MAG: hypothetical protein V3U11_09160 [Planctomycetota bacterium]